MADSKGKFACGACKRQYTWKAELAGKKAKCKCGHSMLVPPEPPDDDQGEYDLADGAGEPAPAPPANPCPNCGQELSAGAVLCVACGYNLKTGKKMGTRLEADVAQAPASVPATARSAGNGASPAPARSAPPIAPYGAPKKHGPVEEDSGKGKMIAAVVVVLLILGGVGATAWYLRGGHVSDNLPAAVAGDDAETIRQMRDNGTQEAKAFLDAHESRMLGMTKARHAAYAFIKDKYDQGAKEVRVFSNGLMAREIIIIMPDDPAARQRLIKEKNRQEQDAGLPLTKDIGQRYLRLDV